MLFPELDEYSADWSVGQVVRHLKGLLDSDSELQGIRVLGEISGCKIAASGHCYFTLKDAEAQLNCVFFKQEQLRARPPQLRDGLAVAVSGRFSLYERDGRLQLYVSRVETTGQGALAERFELLKSRLRAEGLFDETRKRPLPLAPAVIGIVTSLQAAALQDMLRVLRARYPLAEVVISPSLVQGNEAPATLAAALDLLNEHGIADVIILARGGGSLEDLWAFNEEIVARAIARSRIPVISGVGHETDFTIADFVADYRASTPTAAATKAVPDILEMQASVLALQQQLDLSVDELLQRSQQDLALLQRRLERESPRARLERLQQDLDGVLDALQEQMQHRLELQRARLDGVQGSLAALNPALITQRGYSIVRRADNQSLVTSLEQVQPGTELTIEVADGVIAARVTQS